MNSYDEGNIPAQTDEPPRSGQNLNKHQKRAIAAALTGTAALGGAAYALSRYDTTADNESGIGIFPEEAPVLLSLGPNTAPSPPEEIAPSPAIPVSDVSLEPQLAMHNYGDLSFNEAFAEARHDMGPGHYFEWHGNYYNTYYKEEWEQMSAGEHDAFVASLNLPGDSHDQPNGAFADNQAELDVVSNDVLIDLPSVSPNDSPTPVYTDDIISVDPAPHQPQLVVDDVAFAPASHSAEVELARVEIDGHRATLVDTNHDSRADILIGDNGEMLVDTDQDGHFDTYATYDVRTDTISNVYQLDEPVDFVAHSAEQVADNEAEAANNALGDDFNNHADVSDFVA